MRKILLLVLTSAISYAQNFGNFASAIQLQVNGNSTYYNLTGGGGSQIGNVPFSGDLGSFYANSACLVLKGAELKTWKNWGANVCETANLNYLIYPTGNKPASVVYSKFGLLFKASCVNGTFTDGVGGCSGSDQKWGSYNQNIDLTGFLPGNYTLEAWIDYTGSDWNSQGCETRRLILKSTNPSTAFSATFTINSPNTSQLTFAYDNEGNQISRTYGITELKNYGCSNSSSAVDNLESKVTVAPSPVYTTFKLIWLTELVGQINTVSIQAYNNFYSLSLPIGATQTEQFFDLTNQAKGIYFIQITLKDGRVIYKTIQKL